MTCEPAYVQNFERFEDFYAIQRSITRHLARHGCLIEAWLAARPFRGDERAERRGAGKAWRTARLNLARRRELKGLAAEAGRRCEGEPALAEWLLARMPVRSYLEIADGASPDLRTIDPEADRCRRELTRARDALFDANFGLVRNAAMGAGGRDYNDRLSAASCGLLDAVDRYVPGPTAARFSYFASYWIRYHVSRHAQKFGSLISFPINQQRIGRQIDRYLDDLDMSGQPPPSLARLCTELRISEDAYFCSRCRPQVVSLYDGAETSFASDHPALLLCDPAPEPAEALDEREIAAQLRLLLKKHVGAEARVMLAYSRGVGSLSEAAEDHLAHLAKSASAHLRQLSEGIRRSAFRG
jgi:DNA-directed RNA polymerase specialized sigma subunit